MSRMGGLLERARPEVAHIVELVALEQQILSYPHAPGQVHSGTHGAACTWQWNKVGPLFGARASTWAQTWEGPRGWGTPVYEHVLDRARTGPARPSWTAGVARVVLSAWQPNAERPWPA